MRVRWGIVLLVVLVGATIGMVVAGTIQVEKEVRITARQLEDGRVEFGLQERTDGGEWGDTLLPTKNKFPARESATVDKWLYSSAVALTPVERETPPFGAWRVFEETTAVLPSETGFADLILNCDNLTTIRVGVRFYQWTRLFNLDDQIDVEYSVEGGPTHSAEWWVGSGIFSLLHPSTFRGESQEFAWWLYFNATQSPTLALSTTTRFIEKTFSATFALTDIHTVLEALPCFDPV